ncbi:hypothetical protein AGLY_013927, partial [Aphis glycines]
PDSSYTCLEDACSQSFNGLSSFKKHVNKKHAVVMSKTFLNLQSGNCVQEITNMAPSIEYATRDSINNYDELKDPLNFENLQKNFPSPSDDDLATFMLLPYMFQPTNVAIKNKRTYKPSKIEQSMSFITYNSNANELKTLHKQKVDFAFNLDLIVQPYTVIVGDINDLEPLHSYVIKTIPSIYWRHLSNLLIFVSKLFIP